MKPFILASIAACAFTSAAHAQLVATPNAGPGTAASAPAAASTRAGAITAPAAPALSLADVMKKAAPTDKNARQPNEAPAPLTTSPFTGMVVPKK